MMQERLNYLILLLNGVSRGEFGYSSTLLPLALTLRHIDKAIMPRSGEKFANVFPCNLRRLKIRINVRCKRWKFLKIKMIITNFLSFVLVFN